MVIRRRGHLVAWAGWQCRDGYGGEREGGRVFFLNKLYFPKLNIFFPNSKLELFVDSGGGDWPSRGALRQGLDSPGSPLGCVGSWDHHLRPVYRPMTTIELFVIRIYCAFLYKCYLPAVFSFSHLD